MSPGTLDLILFSALAYFAARGYMTGFVRAIMPIAAVVASVLFVGWQPQLGAFVAGFFTAPTSPEFPLAVRIASWISAFLVFQFGGYLLTGIIKKLGLGGLNRVGGLAVGAATGALFGCVPLALCLSVPAIAQLPPVNHAITNSVLLGVYAPIVRAVVPAAAASAPAAQPQPKPPAKPEAKRGNEVSRR